MTAPAAVRLRACAKLNLSLEILGRRPDGYHELRSVLQTIALWDDLDVSVDAKRGVTIDIPAGWDVPHGESNLAVRAVRRYVEQSQRPVALRLLKRIPPAAGLGGGSSDAAAALRGCDLLNPAPYGSSWLQQRAAELGSDVPFFVRGGTQLAEGRGELLSSLPDAPVTWFVLVVPPITLAQKTATLYGQLDGRALSPGNHTRALCHALSGGHALKPELLCNAFDLVAERAFPDLARYRDALRARCGHAVLCGAGPALFALAESDAAALSAVADLTAQAIPALATRTVGRDEATQFER